MKEHAERALSLVGTPFEHQGRLPGFGLDCLGLVVECIGAHAQDRRDYSRVPDYESLEDALRTYFTPIDCPDIEDAPLGVVLAFGFGARRRIRHLGIRTHVGMVHAVDPQGVVESVLIQPWISRFAGAYRWRN